MLDCAITKGHSVCPSDSLSVPHTCDLNGSR